MFTGDDNLRDYIGARTPVCTKCTTVHTSRGANKPASSKIVNTIHDIAAAILSRTGPIEAMKLHKLSFYAKAWHSVWHDAELFEETFQAWRNGPMSPELYTLHRGTITVTTWPQGNSQQLTEKELTTIVTIVETYGKMTGQQLSDLVRQETPWRNSRIGINPGEQTTNIITEDDIREFYGHLSLCGEEL